MLKFEMSVTRARAKVAFTRSCARWVARPPARPLNHLLTHSLAILLARAQQASPPSARQKTALVGTENCCGARAFVADSSCGKRERARFFFSSSSPTLALSCKLIARFSATFNNEAPAVVASTFDAAAAMHEARYLDLDTWCVAFFFLVCFLFARW